MELSIEEKAKRYDEALEKSKILYEQGTITESLCYVFPELKESEDEKIRKVLLELINTYLRGNENGKIHDVYAKDILAWLEKQGKQKYTPKHKIGDTIYYNSFGEVKSMIVANVVTDSTDNPMYEDENGSAVFEKDIIEQKSTDKVELKFNVGDWVVWDNKISCHIDNIYQGKESLMYTITDVHNITRSCSVKGFDNNAHLWTIQDAKDGDVLTVDNVIFIYERTLAKHIVSYCKLINDIFEPSVDARTCCEGNTYVHPATKEQRDLLFQKMHEAGYEWDAEKKELKKINDESENYKQQVMSEMTVLVKDYISQKPAWSEEDDKMLNDILMCGERHCYLDAGNIAWLKSLKDRVTIQPRQEWNEEDEQYLLICKNALAKYQVSDKWDAVIISQWLESRLKSLRPRSYWKPSGEQIKALEFVIESLDNMQQAIGHIDNVTKPRLKEVLVALKKLREE